MYHFYTNWSFWNETFLENNMNKLLDTTLGKLRFIGFGEAISWLLLLAFAMPLKYFWHQPIFVKYVGWIHGLLFIGYISLAIFVKQKYNWTNKKLFLAFIAAFLPFGTFIFDKQLKLEMQNATN